MFAKTTWLAFFIVTFLLLSALFFCAVSFKWNEQDNPVASNLTVMLFLLGPAGNVWMIFDCLSHDGRWTRKIWLALFVPLIISSGGNSGSQATTLIIRAMALGEVTLRDWWHVMRREAFSGLTLGAILGSIGFLRIAFWTVFSKVYGPHWALIGLTIFFSLIGVVMWGTLAGSMLPFVLRRCGLDPAASSAPFVATLVDVTGLIIYFSIAMLVLRGTLL